MHLRRIVGLCLAGALSATTLVAISVGSMSSAQLEDGQTEAKALNDPGNSPKGKVAVSNPARDSEAVPQPVAKDRIPPSSGTGKTPDWFLKTDPASRAQAKIEDEALRATAKNSLPDDLPKPNGQQLPRPELPPKQTGNFSANRLTREQRRAARLAEGDPVATGEGATARTNRERVRPAQPTRDGMPQGPMPLGTQGLQPGAVPAVPPTGARLAPSPLAGVSVSSAKPGASGPALVLPGESAVKSSLPTAPAFIKNAKTVTRTLSSAPDSSKGALLVESPEGFSAPVTDGSVVFASADDPEGAIRLESTNGEFVGLRPLGAPKVKPIRNGTGARWVGAVGGSDLVESPTANGAKGEIVLAVAPQKDPVWDFELVLSPGLIPMLGNGEQSPADVRPIGESIRVRNAAGAIVAEVPAGLAIDAKDARSMLDVSLRRAKNDRWIVSYAADNAWLRSADRVYPVRVDPSIWRGPTGGSLRTLYEGGGSSAAGFPMMISDQYWGWGTQYAMSKFDTSGLGGSGNIGSAYLAVSVQNCDAPYAWSPYAFPILVSSTTTPWDPASLTWASKPAVGPEQAGTPAWGTTLYFNVTNDVAWWANGNGTPGFQIRMDRWPWAGQPNYCYLSGISLLVNTYNVPNSAPSGTMVSPADGATGVSTTPTVQMSGSDPDGDPLYYFMYTTVNGVTYYNNGGNWGSSPNWTMPVLPYLTDVTWYGYVWDGVQATSTYVGARTFKTITRSNLAPAVVPTAPANGATVTNDNGSGSTITLNASATDPNGDPVEYYFVVYTSPSWAYVTASGWIGSSSFTFNAPYGADYYWGVYAHDLPPSNSDPSIQVPPSEWRLVRSVKRPNTGPSLPTLGAATPVTSNTFLLSASSTDPQIDPIQYRFYVCPIGGSCVVSPWTGGSWTTPGLAYNTSYEWYAEAQDVPPPTANAAIMSGASVHATFAIGVNPTNPVTAPVLVAPASGSSTTTRPFLEVAASDADTDPVEYAFQICAPDFSAASQCYASPWQASRFWRTPVELNWGIAYSWRAWARNTNTNGPGIPSASSWTVMPNTVSVNTPDQLSASWAPNLEIDGTPAAAVNEALGEFTTTVTDASVAAPGPGVSINRTYLSDARRKGAFGRNWATNLDIRMYRASSSSNAPVIVVLGDGRREYFSQDAVSGVFVPSNNGTFADLVSVAGGYQYTNRGHTKVTFDANGRATKVTDANLNDTTFVYDANGRVNQIVDNSSGRALSVNYNAAGLVSSVLTPSISAHGGQLTWQYSYDTFDQLGEVCPPASATPQVAGCYKYVYTNNRLSKILNPRGKTDANIVYDNTSFTVGAPNLLVNPSFEDAAFNSWYQWGAGGINPTTVAGAKHGSNSLVVHYANGTMGAWQYLPVKGNQVYTFSAQLKGASAPGTLTGKASPYFYANNAVPAGITEGPITDISGEWKTPIVGGGWTSTRGQFRTPENAAFAWVGYIFYQEDGLNADVYLDNVSLEEGDGKLGRVLSRTDAAGNVTTYAYNPVPNTTDTEVWTTDPKPVVGTSKSTYNVKNQITKNIDGAGRTSTYTYDAMGFRQAVLDPAGRTTVFINDGRGNTRIVDRTWLATGGKEYFNFAPGTSNLVEYRDARSSSATDNAYRTTFGYSAANTNLRTSQTDPTGQTKLWTYTDGSEQAVNGAVGQKQPKGLLKTMSDRTAVTTQFSYGVTGDLITKSDPASGVQVTAYDEIGRPVSVTHQAVGVIPAATTTLVYDVRSHMIKSTGPAILNVVTNVNHQLQVETIYDNNGNPTQVELKDLLGGDPTRTMTTQYDDLDRPVTITQPGLKVTTMGYDEDGNVVATTGTRGLTVTSTFDDRGLPLVATATNYADSVGGAARPVVLSSSTYDVLGRLVTGTDSVGRVAETQYWPDDRVRQVLRKNYRNRDGSVRDVVLTYQEYDAVGNVILSRKGDAAHGSVSVGRSYDANGFVTTERVDPSGLNRLTSFGHDAEGRVMSQTTGSVSSSVIYDPAGRQVSVTVAGVGTDSFIYDGWGRVVQTTNKRGYVTDLAYDAAGRVLRKTLPSTTVWDATGSTSSTGRAVLSTGYDTFGAVSHDRDARGLVTSAVFDTAGRVASKSYPTDAGVTPAETFSYDGADNVVSSTNRRGGISTRAYDLFNRPRSLVDPVPVVGVSAPATTQVFDDVGQLTSLTAPDGSVTNYGYDDLGRQRTQSQVVRQPVTQTLISVTDYDDAGNVVFGQNPAGKTTSAGFNGAGQIVSSVDEVGVPTSYGYVEPTGWTDNVVVNGQRKVKYTYDSVGRKLKVDAMNTAGAVLATDQWLYNANSDVVSHTRPNGAADTFVYDELGRFSGSNTLLAAPAVYSTVTSGFDVAGNMVRLTDPMNNVTRMQFNNWGLLKSTIEPPTTAFPGVADGTWGVGYDAGGLPVSESRPGGVSVARVYDGLGRLTSETGSGTGAVAATRQYAYDSVGRVTSAGVGVAAQSFTYDDRGLVLTANGGSGSSSFTYDVLGRMASRTDGSGTASFGYTDRNELSSYAVGGAGGASVSQSWNAFGQLDTVNYPSAVTRKFTYDDMGRLTDDSTVKSATSLSRQQYGYNTDSSLASKMVTQTGNMSAGSFGYTYDAGSRLTGVTGPGATTYSYDKSGNRLSANGSVFTYDQRNRLLGSTGAVKLTYSWTARGTLVSAAGNGNNTTGYTFDGLDRLAGVGGVTYGYDSLDRVRSRTLSSVTSLFAYAGFESDPVSDGATTYARSPGGRLLGQTKTGVFSLLGADRHGDVSWTLNPVTGLMADSVVNDPFGNVLGTTGSKPTVGFQGDWTDPTSGLVWMAARWYQPKTGTFVSRDIYAGEIGAYATVNRYTYGLNNPLFYTDPTGRAACGDVYCEDWTLDIGNDAASEIWAYRTAGGASDAGGEWDLALAASWVNYFFGGAAEKTVSAIKQAYAGATELVTSAAAMATGTAVMGMSPINPSGVADVAIALRTAPSTMLRGTELDEGGWFFKNPGNYVFTRAWNGVFQAVGWGSPNKKGELFNHAGAAVSSIAGEVELVDAAEMRTDSLNVIASCLQNSHGVCHEVNLAPYSQFNKTFDRTVAKAGWNYGSARTRIATVDAMWQGYAYAFGQGAADMANAGARTPGNATNSMPKVCPGNSFVGETLVLMADGSTKSIENVAVGDEVLTTDPETGRTEAHRVIDHITGEGEKHLVDVKIKTKDGVRTLVATGGHPIWITDTGKWVRASDLVVGEHFRSASAASEVIVGVRKHDEFVRVHNLSVDGIHTYYVLAGRESVLVHNQSNPGYPVIPPNATVRVLTPSTKGGAQYGVEYKWVDANGQTNRFRVHGSDGTAPFGSNAAEGEVSVWQVGSKYVGPNGELYPPGVVNPNSSNYDPVAANDIHRPWAGGGC